MKHTRRLMTAIPAALLGVALAAATAACQPANGAGTESTADVCADLNDNLPVYVANIAANPLNLGMYPANPSPADQAKIVSDTRASYSDLSAALREEADYAEDPATAAALLDTADRVDARASTINTVEDVSNITLANEVDTSPIDSVCSDNVLDRKSG